VFLLPRPKASCQNGVPLFFCPIFGVRFYSSSLRTWVSFVSGEEKNRPFYTSGNHQLSKINPVVAILFMGNHYFGIVGALMTLFKPVDSFLHENLFFWMPDVNNGLDGTYSKTILIVTYSVLLMVGVFLVPMVEELYFRGYLLPRMKGKYAMLFHSFLFASIHVWSPWMIIARTVGFLPIIIGTTKKNIYIGMIVHMLCNAIDFVTGVIYISKMM
jgi:membrane protease YdiL (CAAX protease family)